MYVAIASFATNFSDKISLILKQTLKHEISLDHNDPANPVNFKKLKYVHLGAYWSSAFLKMKMVNLTTKQEGLKYMFDLTK